MQDGVELSNRHKTRVLREPSAGDFDHEKADHLDDYRDSDSVNHGLRVLSSVVGRSHGNDQVCIRALYWQRRVC